MIRIQFIIVCFFSYISSCRSLPGLGPGGIPDGGVPAFVVQFPPPVSSFMGETHLALMNISDSIIPVDLRSVRLPEKKVDDSSDYQHAFCLHNQVIRLWAVHVIDVNCCSNLCNACPG